MLNDAPALTCSVCGLCFVVPARWVEERRAAGSPYCCPDGHEQSFEPPPPPVTVALQAEIKRLRRANDRLAEKVRMAARNELPLIVRPGAGGICPACQRVVKNLASHLRTRHPGFRQPNGDAWHGET